MARGDTIAGLDIGTTKTCAVIVSSGADGLEIIGIGEAPSTGMRKGVVTDLEATVHAIEAATEKAERMAGVHVSHVYVGVTGEHMQSTNNHGVVAVTGEDREVIGSDVRRVVDASKIINLAADRQIIHALPRHYTIDGQDGITDPVGMSGGRLEVDTHIVTGGGSFISNVLKCVHRAGLEPAGIVFEPLASAAATLLPEEKQVGVVLLDIGGGTTDIAVFADGGVMHSATIPVGGNILTNDIALGLKTTFAEAENVKRTYGSGLVRADEADQTFQVKTLDGRSTREVTSSQLRGIVVPRVLEIFRLAKANVIDRIPRDQVLSEVVITGGGAHLRGIETTAAEVFGLPVRIGVPSTVAGLTDAVKQPEYATAVGLVLFGPRGEQAPHLNGRSGAPLGAFVSWFKSLWN
ncbi:MAG: cell division protein FtsA [Candidatus Eremiobacteraeota bacterium]|jgi:cell division protein FtsA|nr:cell division protein FtsA [Candidatus Eremiobacteraeota bacterium]